MGETLIYRPQNWVIVKIIYNNEVNYKVFGGWRETFETGASWKMNSGIAKFTESVEGGFYQFFGFSGNIYECQKSDYGMSYYMEEIYEYLEKELRYSGITAKMEILDNTNFLNLFSL